MRRYKIEIEGGDTYDSAPNGTPDPNALQVDMDIQAGVTIDTPQAGSTVRIWGVGIQKLAQSQDLYNKTITISGGMARGLPLAKPQQFGKLARGTITQAFGEWEGVNQHLDLIFAPNANSTTADGGPNPKQTPVNLVLNAKKGANLADAVKQALTTAFPQAKVALNVAKELKVLQDQIGYHANLQQFAYYIRRLSQDIGGKGYQGISIVNFDSDFNVADGPQQSNGQIAFEDLIGQPTWISVGRIQFKTVMRADIKIMDNVTLPKTWINVSGNYFTGPGSNPNQQLGFQGNFQVASMRHVGFSRQASGDAWVTVFEATTQAGAAK